MGLLALRASKAEIFPGNPLSISPGRTSEIKAPILNELFFTIPCSEETIILNRNANKKLQIYDHAFSSNKLSNKTE